MKFPNLFYVLLLIFTYSSISAQTSYQYQDKFILKNYITIYGELVEIRNDTFFLELENGNKSYLKFSDVKDVQQFGKDKISQSDYILLAKTNILQSVQKDYFQISLGFGFGQSIYYNSIILNSLSLELKYKRRYHPKHFFTASYALEIQEYHSDALFHPITIGHESILFSKTNTPFLNFNFGYGFAHNTYKEAFNHRNTRGGLRYSVGTGMLFRIGNNSIFKTGLEFVVQHSKEYYENSFSQIDWKYTNSRLVLSTGIMF